jgi:hypothetical protein
VFERARRPERAAGKTRREALRCLKPRLSDIIHGTMIGDAARLDVMKERASAPRESQA